MKLAVVGLGLIGGSFEKAARRAGYEVAPLHHGDATGFEEADVVLVCLPPQAIVPWIAAHADSFKPGACVIDIAGVKRQIVADFRRAFPVLPTAWTFVGGHPMAGREVSGYENALATLFDGASMILTPLAPLDESLLSRLQGLFRRLGFARVVVTDATHHDEMIAFTSQLCHVIATAYARDERISETAGFSAGSYADMTRIATQDPDLWSRLFLENADALVPVLDRFGRRLREAREALAAHDGAALRAIIAEGAEAKRREQCSARS